MDSWHSGGDGSTHNGSNTPMEFFKKVIATRPLSSASPANSASSIPHRERFNESIHEDSSPERPKRVSNPPASAPRAIPRRTPRRQSAIKPLYVDDEDHYADDLQVGRHPDEEPSTPPTKLPRSSLSPPTDNINANSSNFADISPQKLGVASATSPLTMATPGQSASVSFGVGSSRIISLGASPKTPSVVALPKKASPSFVYPPASSERSTQSRRVGPPLLRTLTRSGQHSSPEKEVQNHCEDGIDWEQSSYPAAVSLGHSPPAHESQGTLSQSPPIDFASLGSFNRRVASSESASPQQLFTMTSEPPLRPTTIPDSQMSFGTASQLASTSLVDQIMPSSPIIRQRLDEQFSEVAEDDVSDVAASPGHSFHDSINANDQSIIESDGDVIEASPVSSPRRRFERVARPDGLDESVDFVDIDVDDVSAGTPSRFEQIVPSLEVGGTSPFVNRFVLRNAAEAESPTHHVIPDTGKFVDDVENSFDQGTQDSELPPPSIEDDIFASLAAEESQRLPEHLFESNEQLDREYQVDGRKFVPIKDKNTQLFSKNLDGNLTRVPFTSAGLYRRAHDVGKSLFLHGRRSLDTFILNAASGAALPPATGAPDAPLIAKVLELSKDSAISGLWICKVRFLLQDVNDQRSFSFRFGWMLLRNGLGHDHDQRLVSPVPDSWIVAMPLSRVSIFLGPHSDHSIPLSVMCASWTSIQPSQFGGDDSPEIARSTADLLRSFDAHFHGVDESSYHHKSENRELCHDSKHAVTGRVVWVPKSSPRRLTRKRPLESSKSSPEKRNRSFNFPALDESIFSPHFNGSLQSGFPSLPTPIPTRASESVVRFLESAGQSSPDNRGCHRSSVLLLSHDTGELFSLSNVDVNQPVKIGQNLIVENPTFPGGDFKNSRLVSGLTPLISHSTLQERVSSNLGDQSTLDGSKVQPFLNDSQSQRQPVENSDVTKDQNDSSFLKLRKSCVQPLIVTSPSCIQAGNTLESIASLPAADSLIVLSDLDNSAQSLSNRVNVVCRVVVSPIMVSRWQARSKHRLTLSMFVWDCSLGTLATGRSVMVSLHVDPSFISGLLFQSGATCLLLNARPVHERSARLCVDSQSLVCIMQGPRPRESAETGSPELSSEDFRAIALGPNVWRLDSNYPISNGWALKLSTGAMVHHSRVASPSKLSPFPGLAKLDEARLGQLIALNLDRPNLSIRHTIRLVCGDCDIVLARPPKPTRFISGEYICRTCHQRKDSGSESSVSEIDVVDVSDFPEEGDQLRLIGAPYDVRSSHFNAKFPLAPNFRGIVVGLDERRRRYEILCLAPSE